MTRRESAATNAAPVFNLLIEQPGKRSKLVVSAASLEPTVLREPYDLLFNRLRDHSGPFQDFLADCFKKGFLLPGHLYVAGKHIEP
jgi:hypothetical protein